MGQLSFTITKSFGNLQLVPTTDGLRFLYKPNSGDAQNDETAGGTQTEGTGDTADGGIATAVDLNIPKEAIGGLWATARAFLYGVESLDENVILRGKDGDILIKLYRDKPRGQNGRLSGDEVCWLRIVTGRAESERRRIKLGPRDLICIELACNAVMLAG